MADHTSNTDSVSRPLGGTEYSWSRSIPGGTGITVLILLLSKPLHPQNLQTILHNLQLSHPLLRSKLTHSTPPSLTISPSPDAQVQFHDHPSTSLLLQQNPSLPPFQHLLEHELSQNQPWSGPSDSDLFFCNLYTVEENNKWVLAFRLHTSICDRTSAVTFLRDLLSFVREENEVVSRDEFNLAIENLIPGGKANKPFWWRGVDLIGYSLNSFRYSNFQFKDVESPRSTGVVRLQLSSEQTDLLLAPIMADQTSNSGSVSRPLGGTEHSWSRSIPGGTGITVLALLLSKPLHPQNLQTILHNLQLSHPLLRSKLTPSSTLPSLTISPSPDAQIQFHDHPSTSLLLQQNPSIPPFQQLLEHELSQNQPWSGPSDSDLFFCNLYTVEENNKWVLAFRLHTSICDRTSGVILLGDFCKSFVREEDGAVSRDEFNLAIEHLIPSGKANKPFWSRGVDLIGYSLSSFRFSNLQFKDVESPRSTGVVRLQLSSEQTDLILAGCKSRGIKLCGVISAAAIMAAYSSKHLPDHEWEKYGVTNIVDCRKELEPPLQSHNFGFYHSAVLNTHDITGETELWELAIRCYTSLKNAKNSNKHFSDMGDLNYLMCKAIENPGLTPSSSSRTSLIAAFEDPVIDDIDASVLQQEIGLEDYVGCSSVHGVGPSVAVFDTIRNGALDCSCVYPFPLHSREQMQEFIDDIKRILVNGSV